MDFFGHQRRARTRTARLVLLLAAAVAVMLAAANAAAALAWWVSGGFALRSFPYGFFATNTAVALLLVFGGSLLQLWSLKSGGPAIASQLGAQPLAPASGARDRMLRNVVEEIAIAAAMPVPAVYVLEDDDAINALAAGFTPEDAAVVVTSGALARLTREELQGVIAHEFSHIVNGDMRLNTQLVALLYGLELIPHLGRSLLESATARGPRGFELAPLRFFAAVLGLLLVAVGSVGLLGARVIKAAVSREREYLADAHAVQFTRSRDGIGGALRKVLALQSDGGNRLSSAFAANVSHLFLAAGGESAQALFASHPPLAERVRRIYGRAMAPLEPLADHGFPDTSPPALEPLAFDAQALTDAAEGSLPALADPAGDTVVDGVADAVADAVADPAANALSNAAATAVAAGSSVARCEDTLARDARNGAALGWLIACCDRPVGAKAVLWALLVREHADEQPAEPVDESLDATLMREIGATLPAVDELRRLAGVRWRVPLIELACARLVRALGAPEREVLVRALRRAISSDRRVTANEWMLLWLVQRRLEPIPAGGIAGPRLRLEDCVDDIVRIARLLARAQGSGETEANRRAADVMRALGFRARVIVPAIRRVLAVPDGTPDSAVALVLQASDQSLTQLASLWPHEKPRLVRALLAGSDPAARRSRRGRARARALRECLRALCSAIDCPPPTELVSIDATVDAVEVPELTGTFEAGEGPQAAEPSAAAAQAGALEPTAAAAPAAPAADVPQLPPAALAVRPAPATDASPADQADEAPPPQRQILPI